MTEAKTAAPQQPMIPLAAIPGGASPLNPEVAAGMRADDIARLLFHDAPAVQIGAGHLHLARLAAMIGQGDRAKALTVLEEIKKGLDMTFAAMFPAAPATAPAAPSGNRAQRRASKKGK